MSNVPQAVTGKVTRVLIANRGEIAWRVIRTLRELGIESVAVYSDADKDSLHRFQADFAVRLPGVSSAETYLNIPALIAAVKTSGADAVHPGYGFLSENPTFVRAVLAAGAVFIGPPPEAMERLGNKIEAKNLMIQNGVPVVPGAKEPLKDSVALRKLAKDVGYPMILKAASGGGGRGMRVVRQDADLDDAFQACTREAIAYFGSKDVFAERYIEQPRHIEFQVLFDAHGGGVHLGERDCSVQRRHQKLFEEAPSVFLTPESRAKFGGAAVQAGKAAGYTGVGTVEFICESPERAYFMEMNTRIQVEHPVTELVTGLDLIAWQVRVARGERLPWKQQDIALRGHAVEARINAEDPGREFAPAPGVVSELRIPGGPFVRVDTHLYPGYRIPDAYDSLVAKVICWGETRGEAMQRLLRALAELRLEGVPTTARFHEALVRHPKFAAGNVTTRFLEEEAAYFRDGGDAGPNAAASQGHGAPAQWSTLFAALTAVLSQEPDGGATTAQEGVGAGAKAGTPPWQLAARREGLA
jgi:acetyl-CoA carboxylase biotin carboxylase subunit